MAWVRIDDQFTDHPKVVEVGPLAECLFVRGLTYAARYLTDGFVPASHLRRMGDMDAIEEAGRLVRVGLWHDADGGYRIHDYLDYQPSAEKVKAEREAARQRMGKARSGKAEANNQPRSPEVHANFNGTSDNPTPTPIPVVPDGTREGDKSPSPSTAKDHERRFESFWAAYPRRVGKADALKAWKRIKPNDELAQEMIAAIERQSTSPQWLRDGGQYIPHPSTWLNQGRWEDEVNAGSLTVMSNDPSINPATGKPYEYNHPKNPKVMVG